MTTSLDEPNPHASRPEGNVGADRMAIGPRGLTSRSLNAGEFGTWPGFDVHITGVQRIAAVGATQLAVGQLSAGVVTEEDRWSSITRRPAVAPGGNCEQDVGKFGPFPSKPILVPWRSLGVGALLEDALGTEPLQALGEHLARDPEIALNLVEAPEAPADIPNDER